MQRERSWCYFNFTVSENSCEIFVSLIHLCFIGNPNDFWQEKKQEKVPGKLEKWPWLVWSIVL